MATRRPSALLPDQKPYCCLSSALRLMRCMSTSWRPARPVCAEARPGYLFLIVWIGRCRATRNYCRTAQRNCAPVATRPHPALGNVFVAAINNENHPPYALEMPRKDLPPDTDLPSPWNTGAPGFVGIWSINDNGDVPPRGIIKGAAVISSILPAWLSIPRPAKFL